MRIARLGVLPWEVEGPRLLPTGSKDCSHMNPQHGLSCGHKPDHHNPHAQGSGAVSAVCLEVLWSSGFCDGKQIVLISCLGSYLSPFSYADPIDRNEAELLMPEASLVMSDVDGMDGGG
eukprot:1077144-Pyramimonas_sp.AAC.2